MEELLLQNEFTLILSVFVIYNPDTGDLDMESTRAAERELKTREREFPCPHGWSFARGELAFCRALLLQDEHVTKDN